MARVVDQRGKAILLPRMGVDDLWSMIIARYQDNPLRMKYLAMLGLRAQGWHLEDIGKAFGGHPKGHVSRCLKSIVNDLQKHFTLPDRILFDPFDDDAFPTFEIKPDVA